MKSVQPTESRTSPASTILGPLLAELAQRKLRLFVEMAHVERPCGLDNRVTRQGLDC